MTTKLTTTQRDKLLTAAQNAIEFTVRGTGQFPTDMLRYDLCWPASEQDARRIHTSHIHDPSDRPRTVTLKGLKYPTNQRWSSFGWSVVAS